MFVAFFYNNFIINLISDVNKNIFIAKPLINDENLNVLLGIFSKCI